MDIPKSTVRLFAISASQTWITKKAFRRRAAKWNLTHFLEASLPEEHVFDTTVLFRGSEKRGMHGCDDRCGTIARRPGIGINSVVESRLPKPLVAGSIPVSRSKHKPDYSLSPNSWKDEAHA